MEKRFIKNIEFSTALNLASLVEYKEGQVISRTLVQNPNMSMTLFAFSEGEGISTHSAPGDAMVYILDGEAEVTIGDTIVNTKAGEVVIMPADIPHGLEARKNFKMLLILVK
ncbi:MAG: cupin domain-containing protein [Bacillota bacterium]